MMTIYTIQQQLAALRLYHARCIERAAGPLPVRVFEHAHIHPFTQDEWRVEAEQTQEVINSWEEMEAAYA